MFSTNEWNLVGITLYSIPLSSNIQEMGLTGIVSISLAAVLYIQHCPLIYYAYAGFPVFFWEEVLANRETLKQGLRVLMKGEGKRVSPLTIASQSLLYIGILESLVQLLYI
jgi:GPI ethanolamine phosphate transferase 1